MTLHYYVRSPSLGYMRWSKNTNSILKTDELIRTHVRGLYTSWENPLDTAFLGTSSKKRATAYGGSVVTRTHVPPLNFDLR